MSNWAYKIPFRRKLTPCGRKYNTQPAFPWLKQHGLQEQTSQEKAEKLTSQAYDDIVLKFKDSVTNIEYHLRKLTTLIRDDADRAITLWTSTKRKRPSETFRRQTFSSPPPYEEIKNCHALPTREGDPTQRKQQKFHKQCIYHNNYSNVCNKYNCSLCKHKTCIITPPPNYLQQRTLCWGRASVLYPQLETSAAKNIYLVLIPSAQSSGDPMMLSL